MRRKKNSSSVLEGSNIVFGVFYNFSLSTFTQITHTSEFFLPYGLHELVQLQFCSRLERVLNAREVEKTSVVTERGTITLFWQRR